MLAQDLESLKKKARQIRVDTIDAIGYLGLGHIGGSLSLVEVLTVLYFRRMSIDPARPKKRDRDVLILSKGHAGPVLYSTLASRGYFPRSELRTLNQPNTKLPSHCDRLRTPGMDMTAGSLGQGLSAAVGFALAYRMDQRERNVFCILGDGESNEGQVWEAAMSAAHFSLENLIAFTDCNRLQLDSWTKEIMDTGDIRAKWASFGWETLRINGHDMEQIDSAIEQAIEARGRPFMIVLDTVKGKGAYFAENRPDNHHMSFDYETAREAIRRIEDGQEGS